jgi:PAS domain S-box-containing protein
MSRHEISYEDLQARLSRAEAILRDLCGLGLEDLDRVEVAIQSDRDLLNAVLESSNDHIYFKDLEGRFIHISRGHARWLGVDDPVEVLGKTDFDVFGPEHARQARNDELEIMRSGMPLVAKEEREDWPDGHVTWVSTTKAPLRNAAGKIVGIFGISRDITKQKLSEERLRQAYADLEGRVKERTSELSEANEQLRLEIADRERGEERIRHLNAVLRAIRRVDELIFREDDIDVLAKRACETLVETRSYAKVWLIVRNEKGSLLPVAVSGEGTSLRDLLECFAEGQIPEYVEQALKHSGAIIVQNREQDRRCPSDEKAPNIQLLAIRLEHGDSVYGVMLVHAAEDVFMAEDELPLLEELAGDIALAFHKITLEHEKANLEERYLQAQKMEALGRLAGGVAHDFRNQLTVIGGYGDLLLQKTPADSSSFPPLREICNAVQRSTTLTTQLLDFSRREVLRSQVVNCNEVVEHLVQTVRTMLGEHIEFVFKPAADLGNVNLDRSRFEQAIMNLVSNAHDSMPEGGELIFATENQRLDEDFVSPYPDVRPGEFVVLNISDTGCGMDENTRNRLFEPFFTTKEKGKGTGLGLSMVYGFVKQSGGFILVDSAPGMGTSFKLYLPRVATAVEEAAEQALPEPRRSSGETILVAEDEESVRGFIVNLLEGCGYKVLTTANGQDALELAAGHEGVIDLLITDVLMPQLSGPALVEKLGPIRPKMKVLFISGYSGLVGSQFGRGTSAVNLLTKPFTPDELIRMIRKLLKKPVT